MAGERIAPASFAEPSWAAPPGGTPALSLRQPWAFAVLHLGKRIENRTSWRSCKYRGPIWIHAAKWPRASLDELEAKPDRADIAEYLDAVDAMLEMRAKTDHVLDGTVTHRKLLEHRGGVVGRATIVDVISGPIDLARAVKVGIVAPSQSAWHMGGFALVLDDVRPVPFVECKGALGLFGVSPAIAEKLSELNTTGGHDR